ncbi:GNAT family N-acetyltransferase [Deinococcus detaillensis]|uniref:GNAT family N-acetyltransferase n=1 Tax=Deinococcus detaillensis TaxID=2592048 RepID=A0A553USD6_9DEIO|nr:GNAT family N-acetyltransferase [Deinococcus detaillensis]TSA83126.1 GNAT family N-acetyltransferase [Deinococcus detaillensis]
MIRPYLITDHAACLSLFESNRPKYFLASERVDYEAFLGRVECEQRPYFVLERGGEVVACGGVGYEVHPKLAYLSWGMVRGDLHGCGLGSELTRSRLDWLRQHWPEVQRVKIDTSQHTEAFYARFGFVVVERITDGFGVGLDEVKMVAAL